MFIKRVGNAVVLLPYHGSWETLFESLEMFSEDYMQDREQPVRSEER